MTRVGRAELERMTRLAALEIAPADLPALTEQIGRILDYVSQLESVDAADGADVEWYESTPPPPLRADDVRVPSARPALPATDASVRRDGYFVVPRFGGWDRE